MRKFLFIWILLVVHSSACYALQLNFAYSEFATFAFDLYYNAVKENPDQDLIDDLADFGMQESDFLERASVDHLLLFTRTPHMAEDNFFCKLAQLNAIEDLEQLLNEIDDPAQRDRLYKKIKTNYTAWQQKEPAMSKKAPRVRLHAKILQTVANKNQERIDDFISRLSAFYGTQAMPYSTITIYLCPESLVSTYCNHVMFLERHFCQLSPENVLGVVLHEIAHLLYEYQKTSLKKTIDHFFLHYPSRHAYVAYQYFNEALATATGNGAFSEALTGSPAMQYNNQYIQGFAEAIYEDVKMYLNEGKEMDKAFLAKSVRHFKKGFPRLHSDLSELLRRYIILVDEAFDTVKVFQLFRQHCPSYLARAIYSHSPESLDNTPSGDASLRILVLPSEQKGNLAELRNSNPYLNESKKIKLRKLKENLDFYRDKQGRLYLFFTANNYTELENLIKELKQQRYL